MRKSPISDDAQRRGQLVLNTIPVVFIPVIVTIGTGLFLVLVNGQIPTERPPFAPSPPVVVVSIAVFFSALVMLVRMGRTRASVYVLIGVWTLITTRIAIENSVNSFWPALLILPICAAGLLIDGVASASLAGVATVLVVSLAWLEARQLRPIYAVPTPFEPLPLIVSTAFWLGMFWSVTGLTVLLANGLQRALKQSRAHAEELSQLTAQLEERVQTQTAELLEQERGAAMLEERTRVAREIHDTIAQGLTGIIVQLGAAERAQAAESADAPRHLQLAQQMARESLAEARRSIWNLRSPALEHGTLTDALQGVVARQTNVACKFAVRGDARPLSSAIESALLRVCQEALVNVMKHAHATRADVVLEFLPAHVCLRVSDDGTGFEASVLQAENGVTSGFGLLGMRERIHALGGTLELKNAQGASVVATIPYGETRP